MNSFQHKWITNHGDYKTHIWDLNILCAWGQSNNRRGYVRYGQEVSTLYNHDHYWITWVHIKAKLIAQLSVLLELLIQTWQKFPFLHSSTYSWLTIYCKHMQWFNRLVYWNRIYMDSMHAYSLHVKDYLPLLKWKTRNHCLNTNISWYTVYTLTGKFTSHVHVRPIWESVLPQCNAILRMYM